MSERIRVRITPEFPGLVISADGRIQGVSGKWLKGDTDRDGYHKQTVWRDGKFHRFFVHTAVCTAFHGPRPPGMQVRHLDGTRWNNHADNLAWGTAKENQADRRLHGTGHACGDENKASKLTQMDVVRMRSLHAEGAPGTFLAREFGVSESTVSSVVLRRTWMHLP